MPSRRPSRELLALMALFAVCIVAALYSEVVGQHLVPPATPSSFNAHAQGVKALYLLLEQQGFQVGRLQTSWEGLQPIDGLIIVVEPLVRRPTAAEVDSLRLWLERGGTALYLPTLPARPWDPKDPLTGDMALTAFSPQDSDTHLVQTILASPYTQDVGQIEGTSPLRLTPASNAPYEALIRDDAGILLAHKRVGKGHLLVSSVNVISNNGVRNADNAILLVAVAQEAVGGVRRNILFDEYHHGIGFAATGDGASGGLIASLPVAFCWACLPLFGLIALFVSNGNRRFGPIKNFVLAPSLSSTDYISSMARLFRRAGAADVALTTLYEAFVRDLARNLNVPQETAPTSLAVLAAKHHPVDADALQQLLTQCEAVREGRVLSEARMLPLARQLDNFRRRCHLVGT